MKDQIPMITKRGNQYAAGEALGAAEREELRQLLQLDHSWDKILIVSPIDPPTAYEAIGERLWLSGPTTG